MKTPLRAVGLDWDDFLVKSRDIKTRQHIAVARDQFNREITPQDVDAVWGQGLKIEMAHYYGAADPWKPTLLEHARHLAAYNTRSREFPKKLLPGAKVSVDKLLKSGLPVFVVTSLLTDNTESEMKELGINPDEFLFVHGSDMTQETKPSQKAFNPARKILAARGIAPAQTLYGGDALSDAESATKAGLQFLGVPSGRVDAATFEDKGFRTVPTIADFANYVLKHSVI